MKESMNITAGFTLIEMVFTLVVVVLLATVAAPTFTEMLERNRLKSAAEAIYSDLQYARSESLKQDEPISVTFDAGNGCYGIDDDGAGACSCNVANNCDVGGIEKVTKITVYPNVTLGTVSFTGGVTFTNFQPTRGTTNAGSVLVNNSAGSQLKLIVSSLGRIRICVPAGKPAVLGYDGC
jgi:type IV fimbrial biogenesis protein FimT